MVEQKTQGIATARSQAELALSQLASIREQMDINAYEFLRFKLEENLHHLNLLGDAALAWLYCLRLPTLTEADESIVSDTKQLIQQHLDAMHSEWQAHRHESAVVVWPAGRTQYLQRGMRLNIPQFIQEMTATRCWSHKHD